MSKRLDKKFSTCREFNFNEGQKRAEHLRELKSFPTQLGRHMAAGIQNQTIQKTEDMVIGEPVLISGQYPGIDGGYDIQEVPRTKGGGHRYDSTRTKGGGHRAKRVINE